MCRKIVTAAVLILYSVKVEKSDNKLYFKNFNQLVAFTRQEISNDNSLYIMQFFYRV